MPVVSTEVCSTSLVLTYSVGFGAKPAAFHPPSARFLARRSFCVLKSQEQCIFRSRKRYDSRNRRAQRVIVAKGNSSSTVEDGAAQLHITEVDKTPRVTLKR